MYKGSFYVGEMTYNIHGDTQVYIEIVGRESNAKRTYSFMKEIERRFKTMKKAFKKVAFVLHEAIKFVICTCALAIMVALFALAMALVPFIAVGRTITNGGSLSENMNDTFEEAVDGIVDGLS
jgi:hypothetical protein